MAMLPLILLIVFLAMFATSCKCGKKDRANVAKKLYVFVVFLLYPGMGTKIFRVFKCKNVSGNYFLVADYSVACYQGEHLIATSFAIFCIFFYVCGIPAISLFVFSESKFIYLHIKSSEMDIIFAKIISAGSSTPM